MSQTQSHPGPWRGSEAAADSWAAGMSSVAPSADTWRAADLDPWGVPRGEAGNYAATREPAFLDGYLSGLAHGVDLGWSLGLDSVIADGTPEQRRAYRQGHQHGVEVGRAALLDELLAAGDVELRRPRQAS